MPTIKCASSAQVICQQLKLNIYIICVWNAWGIPSKRDFFKIIALELENRREELLADEEMYWMKDEILSDAEKARNEALLEA